MFARSSIALCFQLAVATATASGAAGSSAGDRPGWPAVAALADEIGGRRPPAGKADPDAVDPVGTKAAGAAGAMALPAGASARDGGTTDTFALVVVVQITTSTGIDNRRVVIGHGLTIEDCIDREAKANPQIVLADGLVVVVAGIGCTREAK